jgi:hypothetical protein
MRVWRGIDRVHYRGQDVCAIDSDEISLSAPFQARKPQSFFLTAIYLGGKIRS